MTRIRRIGATSVVCAVMALIAPQAAAHHDLQYSFSASPSTGGAIANISAFVNFGTNVPASGTIHLPSGALLAHADNSTSPFGNDSPQHGDQTGTIAASSDLWTNGCGGADSSNYALTWVEPMGSSGKPAGTVAELKASGSFFGLTVNKRVFFVLSSGDAYVSGSHYDIVSLDYPDEITCSNSQGSMTVTGYGYAKSGGVTTTRKVGQNPSAGTYTSHYHYTDTGGSTHSDSDAQTFS